MTYEIKEFEDGTFEVHRSDGEILRAERLEWVVSPLTGHDMVAFESKKAAEKQLTIILKRNNCIATYEYKVKGVDNGCR